MTPHARDLLANCQNNTDLNAIIKHFKLVLIPKLTKVLPPRVTCFFEPTFEGDVIDSVSLPREILTPDGVTPLRGFRPDLVLMDDLKETPLDEKPELTAHDGIGEIFDSESWMAEGMRGRAFIPSDGCGHWATAEGFSYAHSDIFGHKPSWATHIVWCNK